MNPDNEGSLSDRKNGTRVRLTRVRCNLTGVDVTPLSKPQLVASTIALLARGDRQIVVGHNLHSAYLWHTDPLFKELYDTASIIIADGKPIEIDARRSLKNAGLALTCDRLGSTDWLPEFLQKLDGERIAIIGAIPEVNSEFIRLVGGFSPTSTFIGLHGGEWNRRKDEVILQLRSFKPSLVVIGLGMPLQEHFLFFNRKQLPECLYILVGGALDQMTGAQKLAPRWVGKAGFEWAWRLLTQPKRLGNRYLIEPWKLLSLRLQHRSQVQSKKSDLS
ncbi:MAG: WecB/TagA/CpsF family glycosyltransferase [Actinobacteria bacterium]|nr:WecB/TagA/CpsF family glycosyltransferase [Actinomycetota bacterium]